MYFNLTVSWAHLGLLCIDHNEFAQAVVWFVDLCRGHWVKRKQMAAVITSL